MKTEIGRNDNTENKENYLLKKIVLMKGRNE